MATIRWGHVWREKADAKHGIIPAADTQHTNSVDEEAKLGEKSRTSDSHEHESAEEPGHLVPAPALRSVGRRDTVGESALRGGTKLARQGSARSEMPPVEEVLKRTVSLSQASLHGG